MNFPGLIFILIAQFLSGRGLLAMFHIKQKPVVSFLLSMITGIVLLSQIPFLLQLCHLPITTTNVGIGILIMVAAMTITTYKRYDFGLLKQKLSLKRPKLYDLIFIVTFIVLMLPSVWYSYFYPPFARDMLSGPEPLAAFAVKEHTLINSIFSVNLESTNNHIKPPFIVGLQIIYKMFVTPFGQIWTNTMALCFIAWIFILLREKLHPLVAAIVMLFFICAPDMYAYTYIMLFDYPNMILFFAGVYFFTRFAQSGKYNELYFSAFLFGLATAIRTETLVLLAMFLPLLVYTLIRQKAKPARMFLSLAVFMGIAFIFYFSWINIYLKYYIPQSFDVSGQINHHLLNLQPLLQRFHDMNSQLIFSSIGTEIYGYIVYFFLAVLIADLIFFRKFSTEAAFMLYGIAVVYFGMAVIGYLIPWVDLMNTTKRALFKFIPLMAIYMRNSGSLLYLSDRIKKYETVAPPAPTAPAVSTNRKKAKK